MRVPSNHAGDELDMENRLPVKEGGKYLCIVGMCEMDTKATNREGFRTKANQSREFSHIKK